MIKCPTCGKELQSPQALGGHRAAKHPEVDSAAIIAMFKTYGEALEELHHWQVYQADTLKHLLEVATTARDLLLRRYKEVNMTIEGEAVKKILEMIDGVGTGHVASINEMRFLAREIDKRIEAIEIDTAAQKLYATMKDLVKQGKSLAEIAEIIRRR